jgi:hypothetical protein
MLSFTVKSLLAKTPNFLCATQENLHVKEVQPWRVLPADSYILGLNHGIFVVSVIWRKSNFSEVYFPRLIHKGDIEFFLVVSAFGFIRCTGGSISMKSVALSQDSVFLGDFLITESSGLSTEGFFNIECTEFVGKVAGVPR